MDLRQDAAILDRAASPEFTVAIILSIWEFGLAMFAPMESAYTLPGTIVAYFLNLAKDCSEPPLVCRRPRSTDAGLWKRTNVETNIYPCGWQLIAKQSIRN